MKADPIVFKINNDAERSVEIVSGGQKDKNGNIVMVDKKTGVQILKVNEDGKPLAGASLAIKDSTGNIIDQWVSTDAAHTIEGKLVEGAEYVLTEIKAPEGYKMASDVTFKANASDKPTVVTMKDDYTEVSIQKTDYNGKAISGATLELKDSTGKVIDTWKTDGTVKSVAYIWDVVRNHNKKIIIHRIFSSLWWRLRILFCIIRSSYDFLELL